MGKSLLLQVLGSTYCGAMLVHYQENKFGKENEFIHQKQKQRKQNLTVSDALF